MVSGGEPSWWGKHRSGRLEIMKKNKFNTFFFISSLILFAALAACTTTEELDNGPGRFNTQLTIYLNGPETASLDVTFELMALNITAEDGAVTEVMTGPEMVNSFAVKGKQILLGEKSLPQGKYEKLQFIVREASIEREGRKAHLAIPEEGIELDVDVTLVRNRNTTLFLNWNSDASIHDNYLFQPQFTLERKAPELSSLLIYVTNENSNNVSVINRQSGNIAATVMVGRKPRGIAISRRAERLRVYVANSGSNSISVIDPTTHAIENEIPIRFGREPESIAVATVSSGQELLFVANIGSNTVSVVDTTTYQELEKIDVGRSPIALAVDPPVERLRSSRFLSFEDVNVLKHYRERFLNVYVVNQDSNNVSVLRIDKVTKRSSEIITLNVDWRPVALNVDYHRGKVYIANYASDKLSVIDILSLVKGDTAGAVGTINNVGFSIIGVVADPVFDRVYLLKDAPGEITIIKPFTSGFNSLTSAMPPVMGTIPVGISPRSLILDPELRKLYVVNSGSDTISVIDKTTKREEDVIPVGRSPYGIAAFLR